MSVTAACARWPCASNRSPARAAISSRVVWFGTRRVGVRAIVDRWFAPATRWFRIDGDDDQLYVVRHDEVNGEWELAALTRREA